MNKCILLFFLFSCNLSFLPLQSQTDVKSKLLYSFEPVLNFGRIVKNAPAAPNSNFTFVSDINFSLQANGSKEWHQLYHYPKTGYLLVFGGLGNKRELGNVFGFVPNMTLNAANKKWYAPRITLGLGVAYFNNPFNDPENVTNLYIGSSFTAMGYASVYVQPRLRVNLDLKAGISVFHCSNGHVQIPNLGINLPALNIGIVYKPSALPENFTKNPVVLPKAKIHVNIRAGMGVHQLARTTEPIGTAKYAVYVSDIYISRRFGAINNVQAGIEINHYNSYYNYIVRENMFGSDRKLKATVVTAFLGHEFMIGHVSLLSQGGINIYNPFYREYVKQFKSDQGIKTELKKYISTRLGLQYYIWDPKYCTRHNIFVGAYIKANFGQADFICSQVGFVL
jgi:hypothetical protein